MRYSDKEMGDLNVMDIAQAYSRTNKSSDDGYSSTRIVPHDALARGCILDYAGYTLVSPIPGTIVSGSDCTKQKLLLYRYLACRSNKDNLLEKRTDRMIELSISRFKSGRGFLKLSHCCRCIVV